MTMKVTVETAKRIDAVQLHGELVAAGIAMQPMIPGTPLFMRDSNGFTVVVPDGTDPEVVRRVIAAHQPAPEKTLQQIKQANAEKGFAADDPLAILVRALVLVVADLQNDNAARVAARQPLRTLTPKQIHAAIRDKFGSLTE